MRKVALVASSQDPAGRTMADLLREEFGFEVGDRQYDGTPICVRGPFELLVGGRDIVHIDDLDQHVRPEAFVFLSRHRSESGIPALTVHFTGNFGPGAPFGGRPSDLGHADPSLLRAYLRALWGRRDQAPMFEIVMEATHHGPTSLARPTMFVEIGSSEAQWKDVNVARLVLEVLLEATQAEPEPSKLAIGFGGPHYAYKFTKLLLESDVALGPVAAKYALSDIGDGMVRQMVGRTRGTVRYAAVEWKGLGAEKDRVLRVLQDAQLEILRV